MMILYAIIYIVTRFDAAIGGASLCFSRSLHFIRVTNGRHSLSFRHIIDSFLMIIEKAYIEMLTFLRFHGLYMGNFSSRFMPNRRHVPCISRLCMSYIERRYRHSRATIKSRDDFASRAKARFDSC